MASIDGVNSLSTVPVMTTTTEVHTSPMYQLFLLQLGREASPLATITGNAISVRFAFDDKHQWVPVESLMTELSKSDDKDVLDSETCGGRLPRCDRVVPTLQALAGIPDLVQSAEDWERMTNVARELADADRPTSYQVYADLVDDLLLSIHPPVDEHDRAHVEINELDEHGNIRPDLVDWRPVNLEGFMEFAGVLVDTIELSYPGHGHTAQLTFTGDGRIEVYHLTVPANDTVADLMDHHTEYFDVMAPIPVLDLLNHLSDDELEQLLDLADADHHDDSVCSQAARNARG